MSQPTDAARIQRMRRRAMRQDERLVKLSERSRWFPTYGPFMIVDPATNGVIAYGMSLEAVEDAYV